MAYTFDQIFAADPANPENVAGGASVLIFAPGDTTMTPLSITTPDGAPLANPIQTNTNGFGSAFAHATLDRVAWSGGGFTGYFTSYEGMKAVAVEAAQGASDSAAEAAASAALVGAPADDAVAAALGNTGTASRAAAEAVVSGNLTVAGKVDKTTLAAASDQLAYLDSVKIIGKFPAREGTETNWPQGVSINKADNEYYVANQNGGPLRIDVRELGTDIRKSSKSPVVAAGSYTQGPVWFKNASGDLCFILEPVGGGAVPSNYAIYNYTKDTISANIPILGFSIVDTSGNIMVRTDAWTNTITRLYFYDWASVQAGTPTLLATVPVENAGAATVGKNQGMGVAGGHVFLAQGSQSEAPSIQAYDFNGRLKTVRSYTKADLKLAINKLLPGTVTVDNFLFECEGATHLDGKLVTAQLLGNNLATNDAVVYLLQHSSPDGVRITPSITANHVYDTGWVDLTLEGGWTVGSSTPRYRRIGNQVMFKGAVSHSTASTTYTTFATLPAGVRPTETVGFAISANTTATMNLIINTAGQMQLYSSAATVAQRQIAGVRFFLD